MTKQLEIFPELIKYIYESPDGGKTIYRREFGNYDNREKIYGTLEIPENYWESSHDVEYVIVESE